MFRAEHSEKKSERLNAWFVRTETALNVPVGTLNAFHFLQAS